MPAEWISYASDAVLAVAALLGSIVALVGLRAWRTQRRQGEDHDLARALRVSLFRYRDAIRNVRSPAMFVYEMPAPPAEQGLKMTHEEKHHYGVVGAFQARLDRVTKVREDLYPNRLEADAMWGPDFSTRFRVLEKLERELSSDIRSHVLSQDPNLSEKMREAYADILRKKREVLYEGEPENDSFRREFDDGSEAVETYVKAKLIRARR